MTRIYADTSAVINAVHDRVSLQNQWNTCTLLTSDLTLVELARSLRRVGETGDVWSQATLVLTEVDLLPLTFDVLVAAGSLRSPHLKSLDALHVASALLIEADVVLTHDKQMARACEEIGLSVG